MKNDALENGGDTPFAADAADRVVALVGDRDRPVGELGHTCRGARARAGRGLW